MPTPNETIVTEEEQQLIEKDNQRFLELNTKVNRTDDESKEFDDLKKNYGKRAQERIKKEVSARKQSEYEAQQAKEEAERLRKENEELKNKEDEEKRIEIDVSKKTVDIGGKKYLTDEALSAMIANKEITEEAAIKYQRERNREEDFEIWDRRKKEEDTKKDADTRRMKDAEWVNTNYPQFNKNNPGFNSDDPLYKKSVELYTEAYAARPDGLSLAIKRAKEILRIQDTAPDRSDELHLDESDTPPKRGGKEKEITLSEDEKKWAIAQWCKGDTINPRTKREYTETEALAKALEAKKGRMA